MNDWQVIILEELKALNRKVERLDLKIDHELMPIRAHVTQVRFFSILLLAAFPLIGWLYKTFR